MSSLRTTLALSITAAILCAASWRTGPRPPREAARRTPRRTQAAPVPVTSPARAGSGDAMRRVAAPSPVAVRTMLPEPVRPPATVESLPSTAPGPRASAAVGTPTASPPSGVEAEAAGSGEVLVGPASRPSTPGSTRPEASDPGLRALERLGVDLAHPEEALRRLVDEYRAALQSPQADAERMAQVDQGMAALVRSHPETAGTLFTLLVQERHRGMGRTLAYLLRDVRRSDQEPPLLLMAVADPDEARRANAVAALAPASSVPALETLLAALADRSAAVRLASAEAIEASLLARPGLREAPGVAARIEEATHDETDTGVAGILARMAPDW